MRLSMGIWRFLNREKKIENSAASIILGIVLLKDNMGASLDETISMITNELDINKIARETGEGTAVLHIENYQVLLALIHDSIPGDEVKRVAEYNYYWPNGVEEATEHRGHIIVSIINAGKSPIEENLLFDKIICAILKTSESLGLYMAGRTLLLERVFYLNNANETSEDRLPLYNWIYFGLRKEGMKHSIYTYGLSDFGKKEMEIVNSDHTFEELNSLMYNLVHYVLTADVHLKSGETVGMTADQKLFITESKGKFIQGSTLKISY